MKTLLTILILLVCSAKASAQLVPYQSTGPTKSLQVIEHMDFLHKLQAAAHVMEEINTNKKFMRVVFSNGTRTDYRLAVEISCVVPAYNDNGFQNGLVEEAVDVFKVDRLGTSAHGSPERQREYLMECSDNAKLKFKWHHAEVGIPWDRIINNAEHVVREAVSKQVVGALFSGDPNVGDLFRN